MEATFLNNQFLVAMPGLTDGHFDHSVTFLCEHTQEGALGLIINRPMDLTLRDMLQHMELRCPALEEAGVPPVYWGGPVHPERGFVLHGPPSDWEATLAISEEVFVTTSRDILQAIGQGNGPERFLVTLGYAGWAAGQLEGEIRQNAWLNAPADLDVLFSLPATDRWEAAARLLGIDGRLLGPGAGHA